MPNFKLYNWVEGIADCAYPIRPTDYKAAALAHLKLAKLRSCTELISHETALQRNFKERTMAKLLIVFFSCVSFLGICLYCANPQTVPDWMLATAFVPSVSILVSVWLSAQFQRTGYPFVTAKRKCKSDWCKFS